MSGKTVESLGTTWGQQAPAVGQGADSQDYKCGKYVFHHEGSVTSRPWGQYRLSLLCAEKSGGATLL